jgi:hypothetical protein
MRRYDNPEPSENFSTTVTKSPHNWTGVLSRATQNARNPLPHLTPKQTAPQHTGLHPSFKHGTEHMDPDGTPTVVIGNLSDLSVTMFFLSPLRSARSLKSKSSRWTTALPTGPVRHPTTGVKTPVSTWMFGRPKTALNHLVARLLVNEGHHGRDVAAFARHPANYQRASSDQAISDPLKATVHLPMKLAIRGNVAHRMIPDLLGYATYALEICNDRYGLNIK